MKKNKVVDVLLALFFSEVVFVTPALSHDATNDDVLILDCETGNKATTVSFFHLMPKGMSATLWQGHSQSEYNTHFEILVTWDAYYTALGIYNHLEWEKECNK